MTGAVFFYGLAVGHYRIFPYKHLVSLYRKTLRPFFVEETKIKGSWERAGNENPDGKKPGGRGKLSTLPYLQGYKRAPAKKNVIRYDENKAYNGLNFCVSGHGPEAFIVDMKGKIKYKWKFDIEGIWPGKLDFFYEHESHKTFWRRAHLFDNGDLLAIFDGIGMIKLDKDSNLLWANQCRSHHDLFVHENGNIYTLTRKQIKKNHYKVLNLPESTMEDFITVLDPDGKIVKSVSILKCLLNSDYAPILTNSQRRVDLLHTNTIEVLGGPGTENSPVFKKGQILVSICYLHTIAVIDIEKETVTWALKGKWINQHQPTLLDNGNLLLFNNMGNTRYNNNSKVVEFDPLTQKIIWEYKGSPQRKLFSRYSGSNQRLPNGNTLITESDSGRVIEVTPEGEVVWEYLNPHRAGKKNELIATLFDVIRIEYGSIPGLGL